MMFGKTNPKIAVLEQLIAEMKAKEGGRLKDKMPKPAMDESPAPPGMDMAKEGSPEEEIGEDDKQRLLEMYEKLKG